MSSGTVTGSGSARRGMQEAHASGSIKQDVVFAASSDAAAAVPVPMPAVDTVATDATAAAAEAAAAAAAAAAGAAATDATAAATAHAADAAATDAMAAAATTATYEAATDAAVAAAAVAATEARLLRPLEPAAGQEQCSWCEYNGTARYKMATVHTGMCEDPQHGMRVLYIKTYKVLVPV
eukprot:353987-Chlamydomonas_euryale.AAC.3